jgi:signal peptidase II
MKTYLKGFMFIFILIIVDQVTKHYFKASYTGVDTVFIRGLIEFSYAENTGMSFGLLKGQTFFFMIITVLALGLFGYLYLDINFKIKKVYSIGMILLIAGTLGNAIDRVFLRYVIDFMHFPFLDKPLALFNIPNFYNNFADMYLSIALVLILVDTLFLDTKRKSHDPTTSA